LQVKPPLMQYTDEYIITESTLLLLSEQQEVHTIWNTEYPLLFKYADFQDFQKYLFSLHDLRHYYIKNSSNEIVAWASDFIREDARWFGIIVKSTHHRSGLGSQLISHLKSKNVQLCGWMIDNCRELKSDGTYYQSPQQFYRQQGFEFHPDEHMGFDRISAIKISWGSEFH